MARDRSPREYRVECENGHSKELTATELESLIRSGEHDCPKCKEALALSDEINLECHICSDVFPVGDLEDAQNTMDTGCVACDERGFKEDSVHVAGSWQFNKAVYDWKYNGPDEKPLVREGRTDYWEAVIHFCESHEFAGIYRERRIRAAKTGYYDLPAVCLTEATAGNWNELQDRHGAFGYLFRKRDIIVAGGGPAIYVTEALLKAQATRGGFADEIKPFINLLRIPSATPNKKKHDFLHEREWRMPRDVHFNKVEPYAVVVGEYGTHTEGWQDIWGARIEFEELLTADERK